MKPPASLARGVEKSLHKAFSYLLSQSFFYSVLLCLNCRSKTGSEWLLGNKQMNVFSPDSEPEKNKYVGKGKQTVLNQMCLVCLMLAKVIGDTQKVTIKY